MLQQWRTVLSGALIYLCVVAFLHYRRLRALSKRLGLQERSRYNRMSISDAQMILKELCEVDCPWSLEVSFLYALWRVWRTHFPNQFLHMTDELCPTRLMAYQVLLHC